MDSIVELRERSISNLEEALEDAREEMFNLRFQRASGQLEDYSRLRKVRQHIARLQTVLNARQHAIAVAGAESEIVAVLAGQTWSASAFFDYELSNWVVTFVDDDDNDIATAHVNLNAKRQLRRADRAQGQTQASLVTRYEIAG